MGMIIDQIECHLSYGIFCLFSRSVMSNSLWPDGLQHAKLPYPAPSPSACSNSYPLSQWCHPTTSSSVIPFSSCLQSFSASGSFLMNQLFTSGGQIIGASTSASVLPMQIKGLIYFRIDWFDLFVVQGLSRVFSNTTAQNHQFFSIQPSSWSNSHIHVTLGIALKVFQ